MRIDDLRFGAITAILATTAAVASVATAQPVHLRIDFNHGTTSPTIAGWTGVHAENRFDNGTAVSLGDGVTAGAVAWSFCTTRDRGAGASGVPEADDLLRDFLQPAKAVGESCFEVRGLPGGTYDITLLVGDPSYTVADERILVNGIDVDLKEWPSAGGTYPDDWAVTVRIGLSPGQALQLARASVGFGKVSGMIITAEPDTQAPAAVTDLAVTSTGSATALLQWTAPADEPGNFAAASCDIRYAAAAIDEASWDAAIPVEGEPAPAAPGQVQTFTVTGLTPETTYYFAIKTADGSGNVSPLSNIAAGTTEPPDVTPPAAITDLAAANVTDRTVTLTWTAPGDDGQTGTAVAYDIRHATSPITDNASFETAAPFAGGPAPLPAGSTQTFTAGGLQPNTTYYFAIRTTDDGQPPNTSDLSNVPAVLTLPPREATYGISNEFSLEPTVAGPYAPAIDATGDVSVTNIKVDAVAITRTVQGSGPVYAGTITYDLAAAGDYVHVWLELSTDGGATWSQRRIHAVGAVGTIAPGAGKTAEWLVDGDRGHHCRIRIRVNDQPATYSDLDADNNKMPRPVPWVEYPLLERLTERKDFVLTDSRYELPSIDFYKSLSAGQMKAGFARVRFFHSGDQYLDNPMYFLHCCYLESDDGQDKYVILQADSIYVKTSQVHAWRDQIHAAFGIPKDHVMVLYTHVHNGGDGVAGVEIFPHDLLTAAMANARPVEVGFLNKDMGTSHNTHRNLFTDATHATSSFSNYLYDPYPGRPSTDVLWEYDDQGNIIGGLLDGRPFNSPVQQHFDCPLDSYLQMIVFRSVDTHEMSGIIVKFTVHPITRDYFGDYPRCVMDTLQDRFGSSVEVMFTSGFSSNHRPLAAQKYPADLGAPRSAAAFADALGNALPSMEFSPLRKLGMVIGYDLFGVSPTNLNEAGTDPDRLGVGVQVFRLNDIYLSTLPGEAPSEQGLYIRSRTSDTKHMYNAYGNSVLYYYTWGRWFDIGHYEGGSPPNRFDSFRMAQEIVRGVSILEKDVDELRLPGDINGDGHCNAIDLLRLAHSWTLSLGEPGFDPACDFNGDGSVNAIDLLTLARYFATY